MRMLHLPWASTKVRNIRRKIELVQKVCRWDRSKEIQIVHTKYICLWQNFNSALLQNVNEIGWFCARCKNLKCGNAPLPSPHSPHSPLPLLPLLPLLPPLAPRQIFKSHDLPIFLKATQLSKYTRSQYCKHLFDGKRSTHSVANEN